MSLRTWFRQRFVRLTLGERGEREAARYLRRQGYRILFTRLRHRYGEIDVLAVEDKTVVFVEVKTRRSKLHGQPAEAVTAERQQRLTRAALAFLKSHGLLEYASRFDIVEVVWPQDQQRPTIQHIRNAFSPIGRGQFFS